MATHDLTERAIDGVAKHHAHPETFEIPDPAAIGRLKFGDFVKIGVERERFWVQLAELKEGRYVGRIDNDLVFSHLHGLFCDDVVTFQTRHILSTLD